MAKLLALRGRGFLEVSKSKMFFPTVRVVVSRYASQGEYYCGGHVYHLNLDIPAERI
jgi:hypothetical protein